MKGSIRFGIGILVGLFPVLVAAQTVAPPPRPLHLVGDHWTPYNPPTEFPEGARVHTIVKGDTLWDLAKQYLGDPYLWPQIWERNPYIRDSHWIYPGDPVVIDVAVQPAPPVEEKEVTPPSTEVSAQPPVEEEATTEGEAVPLGSTADVYCFAVLSNNESEFPFSIVSAETTEYQDDYSEGDIVYINGGTEEGVAAGDRFFILSKKGPLDHPISGALMGTLYRQVGQLRVLCSQSHSSICEITLACDPIALGDVLKPFSPIPVPLAVRTPPMTRCDSPNGKPTGYVVYQKDGIVTAGTDNLVMVDLGSADGVYPGQFATLFHDNPAAGMPRIVLGEVGILTVGEHYATARIIATRGFSGVGERVELK